MANFESLEVSPAFVMFSEGVEQDDRVASVHPDSWSGLYPGKDPFIQGGFVETIDIFAGFTEPNFDTDKLNRAVKDLLQSEVEFESAYMDRFGLHVPVLTKIENISHPVPQWSQDKHAWSHLYRRVTFTLFPHVSLAEYKPRSPIVTPARQRAVEAWKGQFAELHDNPPTQSYGQQI
jgi:hypothetical protein